MRVHESLDDPSVSTALERLIGQAIDAAGGWIPFSRFMALALYAPGLGYYARGPRFGRMPGSGSDFVTAPELSPLFGQALARQLAQALDASGSDELWEFGAGSGALACQLLDALAGRVRRYRIVEVSAALRERQREATRAHAGKLEWLDTLPARMHGVVVANEVLDAMPVDLVHFDGSCWLQRGVGRGESGEPGEPREPREPGERGEPGEGRRAFAWRDRPGGREPPCAGSLPTGTVTELHPQAAAFVSTLADHLVRGAAFFVDYGFPEREYYHPQRSGGTLMCHRGHRADTDPLADIGAKDITAHLDFSALAVAGQDAGLDVIGYTSQARFLLNCGLGELLAQAPIPARADGMKLVNEHEMGELFKVLAFAKGIDLEPLGFASGDRRHRL